MGNRYSKAVRKIVARLIEDAQYFREREEANKADGDLFAQLASQEGEHLYSVSRMLLASANYHGRVSFAQFVGGEAYDVNLADCWEETCLAAKFRERFMQQQAEQAASPEALFQQVSVRWMPSEITSLALDLWKLYAIGREQLVNEFAPQFELFDLRQDVTWAAGDEPLLAYDLAVCVTLLLARENAEVEAVDRLLGPLPVCAGIGEFWKDDAGFAQFTERAAQWHLDYSLENLGEYNVLASTTTDLLVPAWIFTLDKFRQKHLGRASTLGDHELIALGQQVLVAAQIQRHPKLRVLETAERHYEELFGVGPYNPILFWDAFLPDPD